MFLSHIDVSSLSFSLPSPRSKINKYFFKKNHDYKTLSTQSKMRYFITTQRVQSESTQYSLTGDWLNCGTFVPRNK